MKPKQIKIHNKTHLLIKWEDDTESKINLKYLRDECPCAGCKGETVLLKTYRPANKKSGDPNMYKIQDIQSVGGYAIQISWKDGHNTGIYTWEYLQKLANDQDSGNKHDYTNLI